MSDFDIHEVRMALAKKLRDFVKEVDDKGETRMSTPVDLCKADGSRGGHPSWESADGLSIPRHGTPERRRWDKLFVQRIREVFGNVKPRLVKVPVEKLVERNPAVNGARLAMYTKMARGEGKLPPIVVKPMHDGTYYVTDGNHRMAAAKKAKISHLDALVQG